MKNTKKLTAILLTMAMLVGMMTMFASAANTIDSGSIGAVRETKQNNPMNSSVAVGDYVDYYADDPSTYDDSVKWTLDSEGTLTFTGNGAMPPCRSGWNSPFNGDTRIKTVIIKEGIQQIGPCLLYGIPSLTTVIIEDAGTKLTSSWLRDCPNLNAVLYGTNLKNTTCSYELMGTSVQEAMGYPEKTLVFAKTFATYGPWYSIVRDDSNINDTFSSKNNAISYNEMLTRAKTALANVPADVVASMPDAFQTNGTKPVTPKPDDKDDNKHDHGHHFGDVKSNAYYADSVNWAVEQGITKGTTDTTFSPNSTCTTAQILTMLYRAAGEPEILIANPFTDVSETAYYRDAALWAYQNGMVVTSEFQPNSPCTRQSTVTFMWIAAGSPVVSANRNMTDLPGDINAKTAISWAIEQGITKGTTNTTFTPNTTCTRAQIVTFLWRDLAE